MQARLKNSKESRVAGTRAWEQSSRGRSWMCWARQAAVKTWLLPRVKGGATEVLGKEQVRSASGSPRIPLASLLRPDHATMVRNRKPKYGADLHKITQDMGSSWISHRKVSQRYPCSECQSGPEPFRAEYHSLPPRFPIVALGDKRKELVVLSPTPNLPFSGEHRATSSQGPPVSCL